MRFSDFVCFEATVHQLNGEDRDSVIGELVSALVGAGKFSKKIGDNITAAVIKRENEASTGIGKGVAVPHVKHESIKEVIAVVGCKSGGIDFSSLDKQSVYTVILLLSPQNNADMHLRAMENIFKNLQKEDFRKFLRQAKSAEEIKDIILDHDKEAESR